MKTTRVTGTMVGAVLGAAVGLVVLSGCGKKEEPSGPKNPPPFAVPAKALSAPAATPAAAAAEAACKPETGTTNLCNFLEGPADAKVKVQAYYPGRHEDTLAAVKELLKTFAGQVQVEIVDWRTPEGLARRDASGLTCAGIVINGKNAFEVEVNGAKSKVLFVRGVDGEWSKAELEAAVKQELAAAPAGAKTAAPK